MPREYTCLGCGKSFIPKWTGNPNHYCSMPCARKHQPRHRPLEERFWARVNKTDDCWEWTGPTVTGYGVISVNKRSYKAHRMSWMIHNGPIPDGLFICHHCDNRRCVRPDHLFIGTASDNMRDMTAKGRHPYRYGDDHPARKDGTFLPRGEANGQSKLTADTVRMIRAEYARGGVSQQAIADRVGVSQAVVSAIILRKVWKSVE